LSDLMTASTRKPSSRSAGPTSSRSSTSESPPISF
jgi:hypothetical protein